MPLLDDAATAPATPRLPIGVRGAALIVVACLLLAVPAWLAVRHLELRTDFSDLLPEGQPSVVALHELQRRVGGVSTLYVTIEGDEVAAGAFADEFAAAALARLGDDVLWVDHTARPLREFYDRNALLYMSLQDLRLIDEALDRSHRRLNPLFAGLDEDRGSDDELAARIRRMQEARTTSRFPHDHYTSRDGSLSVVSLRPQAAATNVTGARRLLTRTAALVDELAPTRRGLRVSLAGPVAIAVEEYDTLRRDIFGTAALCAALVCFVVWLFLRRLRVVLLLAVPLAFGALYSFAVARLAVGYVNAQTAFLGALIVGTGINYGVVLCSRVLEEMGRGVPHDVALATALRATVRPTLTAALATAVSFAALWVAQIRSFSQFGTIGSSGIVICWVLSYLLLPALLILAERIAPMRPPSAAGPTWRQGIRYPSFLLRLPLGRPRLVLGVAAVAVALSVVAFVRFLPDSLEYDLRNLRNRSSEASPTARLGGRIARVFGESLTPALIAARDRSQAQRLCDALNERVRREGPAAPLKECLSLFTLLPNNQDERLELLGEIRRKAARLPPARLGAAAQDALAELQAHLDVKRLGPDDLPDEISRRFLERDGTRGAVVLVFNPAGRDLWVKQNLFAFTDLLRDIDLGHGEHVHASGETLVFADILRAIERDAPRATVVAAGLVLLVLVVTLRRPRPILQVGACLVAGVAIMAGVAAALRVKYNFFNYVALPTTFGIGLDYAINIQQRAALERPDADGLGRTLRGTGPAVVLASLTTIIGYAVLLIADNRALVSFGALAILGEVTTLTCGVVLLPAVLRVTRR
jgi:hypothetical protein